jgi:hypothetical protein
MAMTRRVFSASALAIGAVASAGAGPLAVRGTQRGAARILPARFAGFNTPVMWDIPYEDPRLRPLVSALRPALLRFPGGTIANYWNWRSGRVEVGADMMGNFAVGARNASELHPEGASFEDFNAFSRAVGAETILVLNLETSSLDDQVAWVKRLADAGVAPSRIEMGNEFYFEPLAAAGSGKPAKTPSQTRALEVSRQFAAAIAPHAPNAKIAVQSSGSRYSQGDRMARFMTPFDDELTDEPWFQAVTWHIYPEISSAMGLDLPIGGAVRTVMPERFRSASFLSAADAELALTALLARVEEGSRRQAAFLRAKLPDKEVWVTEWGTGENLAYYRGERPVVTGLWIHVLARQLMCLLREPNVAMALNHSLYMDGLAWSCIRREDSERQYRPIGAYDVFRWFDQAANAGPGGAVKLVELVVEGARPARGGGPASESFTGLMALAFETQGHSTWIVHNASLEKARLDLGRLSGRPPLVAEAMTTPSLIESFSYHVPDIAPLDLDGAAATLPPRSLARIVT